MCNWRISLENNELQTSPPPPAEEVQEEILSVKKTSWARRLGKWGAWFLSGIVFLLASVALALQFFFPAETLRPVFEKELTKALKQPVTIAGLEVGLFHGIEIRDVQVGKTPLLKVHSLILDYDLSSLLLGQILINRVIVDSPALNLVATDGKWNFQVPPGKKLLAPGPAKKTKPAVATSFPLPLEVDLKHFEIKNIMLDAAIDDQVLAQLAGLDIKAHGKVSQEELNLSATLTLKKSPEPRHNLTFSSRSGAGLEVKTTLEGDINVSARDIKHIVFGGKILAANSQIKAGDLLLSPDIGAEWDMALSLQPELLQIKNLMLSLGKGNQLKLAGEISKFSSQPGFKLNLQEAVLNLKEILELAGNPIKPATADGILKVANLAVSGHLQNAQPEMIAISKGNIAIVDFSANHPQAAAKIDGARLAIDLQDIKLENLALRHVSAQANLIVNKAVFKGMTVSNFNQQLRVNTEGSDPLITKLVFSTVAGNVEYRHPQWGKLGSGLRMEGTAEGDLAAGDLNLFKVKLGSGSFLNASLQGKIKDFGKKNFQVDPSLNLDIDAFLRVLPAEIMKPMGLVLNRGIAEINAHVQGTLDDKFQPQSTNVKADLSLKEVDLQLEKPSIGAKNLTLQANFPLEYSPAKGIKIPVINLNSHFLKIKALDDWEIGPAELRSRLTSQQFFSLTKDPGIVPLNYQAALSLASVQSGKPEVKLSKLALEASVRGDFVPADKDARNITLTGDMTVDSMEGLQKYRTGKVRTVFTVDVHDRTLTRTRVSLKTNILSPSVKHEGADFALGEVKLDSLVRLDPEKGDVDIDWVKLDVPALMNFDAKAQARKWGDTFSAQGKISGLRLDTLWKTLPTPPAKLTIAGTGSLDFSAKGSKPGEEALKNFKIPIEAHARLALNNVSLAGNEPEENQPSAFLDPLKIEGLGYATDVDLKNNDLKITGKLDFGKVFNKEMLGDAWLEPVFNYQYAIADWNKWVFEKHEFVVKNRGVSHTFTGRIEGLKPFFTKKAEVTPAEMVNRLDIALVSALHLKIDQNTALTKNLKADGALSSRQSLSLVPGKEIVLDGEIGFDKFNASVEPSVKVNGIAGRFPFNKKYRLNKKSLVPAQIENPPISQKGFFSQLRNFSAYKNILRIGSIEYDAYKASNVGMDLLYKDNQLAVEKFIFDALKGSLGGQLFLTQSPKGPMLNFSTEFAGVDFDELMGRKSTGGGAKSQIDGNMQFGFKVSQGSSDEKISLDQIDAKIAITRIGDEALERILMFLDPEESKPAIVDTRAKLKLAKPHRMSIVLENGNLSLEIWLKSDLLGGIVKAPELKRVPVTSLKVFRQVSDQLQALAGLRNVLKYLSAQGIEFDDEKGMTLF